jgi:hypothetical protein
MKNRILSFFSLFVIVALLVTSCKKTVEIDSVPHRVSQPTVVKLMDDAYYYGFGTTNIFNDLPNVVAIYVDTIYGFDGGFGGKTGSDSLLINKSDIVSWGDTTSLGAKSLAFKKVWNKGNYAVSTSTNMFILQPNTNPGPTSLEGTYLRASNGYLLKIAKAGPGIFVLQNPGGAASVALRPYLLKNYKTTSGGDSLDFEIQEDNCGGGLQLVAPTTDNASGLSAGTYRANNQPIISSMSPLTLQWKVYEFPEISDASVHQGAALCNWGLGVRTFVKQ